MRGSKTPGTHCYRVSGRLAADDRSHLPCAARSVPSDEIRKRAIGFEAPYKWNIATLNTASVGGDRRSLLRSPSFSWDETSLGIGEIRVHSSFTVIAVVIERAIFDGIVTLKPSVRRSTGSNGATSDPIREAENMQNV
jgi:hypothetical protein